MTASGLTPLHAAGLARLDAWLAEAACERGSTPTTVRVPRRAVRRRIPIALPLRRRVEPSGC